MSLTWGPNRPFRCLECDGVQLQTVQIDCEKESHCMVGIALYSLTFSEFSNIVLFGQRADTAIGHTTDSIGPFQFGRLSI